MLSRIIHNFLDFFSKGSLKETQFKLGGIQRLSLQDLDPE